MKRRILFIDDEPMVLAGLQRMLRPMREQWEMQFAGGGTEALALMADKPFDLVVSDMRMPGMNGAQVLKETARLYPQTIRFILSGQAETEMIMQCVGTAHQFLAKPCDPEALKTAAARAFAVDALLHCDAIKRILSQLTTIPSLPTLYTEIMRQMQSPDSSIEGVGQTIARDAGMTAKILQLVNSAFFGLQRQISNPTEAAILLGLETIKSLVLWIHVFSQFPQEAVGGFSVQQLSNHSLATGILAREIIKEEQGELKMREDAMTAGLLHDVGKLILVANAPQAFRDVCASAKTRNLPLWQVEREQIGATHAEIGAYLLGVWGIPFEIVEAVAMHHRPADCGCKSFSILTAVHTANVLQRRREAQPEGQPQSEVDTGYLAQVGKGECLDKWSELGI